MEVEGPEKVRMHTLEILVEVVEVQVEVMLMVGLMEEVLLLLLVLDERMRMRPKKT